MWLDACFHNYRPFCNMEWTPIFETEFSFLRFRWNSLLHKWRNYWRNWKPQHVKSHLKGIETAGQHAALQIWKIVENSVKTKYSSASLLSSWNHLTWLKEYLTLSWTCLPGHTWTSLTQKSSVGTFSYKELVLSLPYTRSEVVPLTNFRTWVGCSEIEESAHGFPERNM